MTKNYTKYTTPKLHDKLTKLNQLLFSVKYMLAGGSVFSEIQKTKFGSTYATKYSDFDLYFQSEVEFDKVVALFVKEKEKNQKIRNEENNKLKTEGSQRAHGVFGILNTVEPYQDNDSEAAITYYWDQSYIQLIKHFKPFEETLKSFDMVNSQCYSFPPFDTSFAPNDENLLIDIIRNTEKKITFNDIGRVMKYKLNKNLNESNIVSDAFDLFLNYDDDAFKKSLYAGENVDTLEKQEQIVKGILINLCNNSTKFCDYATKQEDIGKRLQFEILDDNEIGYIKTTSIRYLTYLQSLEQQKRGVSFDKFIKAEDYMKEHFPEELL
ncbi:MAG: hypothetical protein J7L15_05345 [Clostridiales bacterium]|nr:hypothetical protein [Clostridiales bacterium]